MINLQKFKFSTAKIVYTVVVIGLMVLYTVSLLSQRVSAVPNRFNPSLAQPIIEIANQSGVAGYTIGIFGTNFGSVQGSVTIAGSSAQITEWADTYVEAIVPSASSGSAFLVITNSDGQSTSSVFELYTINPSFLSAPDVQFRNVAFGKSVYLTNLTDTFCYRQPDSEWTEPTVYLTDYRCGHSGITGDGHALFDVTANNGATIAIDLGETFDETLYLQFFNSSGWYVDQSPAPKNYVIEVSADSTDGTNGSWQAVHSETDNNRAFRLHPVAMPSGGAQWVRLRVTESNQTDGTFIMKELRVYEPTNSGQSKWDMFSIYGDSITKDGNEIIGHVGMAQRIKNGSQGIEDLIFTVYGLSGQNSTGLEDHAGVGFDIYDAFNLDTTASRSYYWGIALGTNDSNDSIDREDEVFSNLGGYDERLDAIVQTIIGRGQVPIVARIPDTDEAQGGFGTLETKKKILADIDRISAQYQLIPGPDLYTAFRRNIEEDNSSWIREGDGTHHSNDGRVELLSMWADAFVEGTNRAALVTTPTPMDTPPPTNTPANTSTPLPTATHTPFPTDTPLPTVPPTAVGAGTPSMTTVPNSTATPMSTTDPNSRYRIYLSHIQQ